MYRILLSIRPLPSSPAFLEDVGDDVADAAVFRPVDLRESSVSDASMAYRPAHAVAAMQVKALEGRRTGPAQTRDTRAAA
jgi:hypothetical protein